ncbi:MAG TPA: glycogen/starch synthase [Pyrinomonadaceae bacterium]|nr:glycogen/starch synthase [Pyrinomonadaceae bacterium]
MRVAFLSSEAVPFAKTGGLGDVAGALPKALAEEGVDVSLIHPLYDTTDRRLLSERVFDNLEVEWLGRTRHVSVWRSEAAGVPAFLIDAPEYFMRGKVYGFANDHHRFAFFSRAALALTGRLGQAPDVVHGNDWPCGFAIAWLWAGRAWGGFLSRTRTLLSIHNLAYQGLFDPNDLWSIGYRHGEESNIFLSNGVASSLKAGLMTCDAISTVSRRYAYEIQTSEQGHGLDWLLRMRQDRLIGITNGVDYDVWNPATDRHIAANFNAEDMSGKRVCKLDLLRRFGLPEEPDRPVIATISRLVAQKGYDIIKQAAGQMLEAGAFFVALGSGESEYENFLQALKNYAPHRVAVYKGFNEPLAHQIEAGADIFLMPSLYEPCGLNQMYSMRYGTVPLVRATGGLDDTVEQFNPLNGEGTGFKFEHYSAQALVDKIRETIYWYTQPAAWRRIQQNGMRVDNSWQAAARKYVRVYHALPGM